MRFIIREKIRLYIPKFNNVSIIIDIILIIDEIMLIFNAILLFPRACIEFESGYCI